MTRRKEYMKVNSDAVFTPSSTFLWNVFDNHLRLFLKKTVYSSRGKYNYDKTTQILYKVE